MYVTHLESTRSDSSRETIGGAESVKRKYHTLEKATERSASCDLRCRVQYGAVAAPPAAAKFCK